MRQDLRNPIGHMLQGLAHWISYRKEMSTIEVIEADAVLVATDLLRASLPGSLSVKREVTRKSLPLLDSRQRIDLGIFSRIDNGYKCLIEFKLADATNGGYKNDLIKLAKLKQQRTDIDCLVVIIFRKASDYSYPSELINSHGKAQRKKITLENSIITAAVRRVCHSSSSMTSNKSVKAICLEVLEY